MTDTVGAEIVAGGDLISAAPPPAEAPAQASAPQVASQPAHCPYRRTIDLLQRLAPGKMRIGFLIGAGCPLAIRVPDGNETRPLIPEIAGLTNQVKEALNGNAELKAIIATTWERLTDRGIKSPTIEDVLSHIRTLKSICGKGGETARQPDPARCGRRNCWND